MKKSAVTLKRIDSCRWKIEPSSDSGMLVPGIIYAHEDLLPSGETDQAHLQVANVACLPGIVEYSLAMPDIHWGYGFPIGGVAAMDMDKGVISPGGVGYDIACGVRLIRSSLEKDEVLPIMSDLLHALYQSIPCGIGAGGSIHLSDKEMDSVLNKGSKWAIDNGMGTQEDLDYHEENGCMESADASCVDNNAKAAGKKQLGTLGSGNHFLEIQIVDKIYDPKIAQIFGLFENQVVVMLHSGSRALGYQVCEASLRIMKKVSERYGINLPDSQLACAPLSSEEGKEYFKAMSASANFAMANRQCMMHQVRDVFSKLFHKGPNDLQMDLVYDVCHNIAKIETHMIGNKSQKLCVHRKGSTRAFPAGHEQLPPRYKSVGQPVLIPGDMGRCSYVLVGLPGSMTQTFGSTCHGAGRQMSRSKAIKATQGRSIAKEMEDQGILVLSRGRHTLAEEASEAYKDVSQVVDVCEQAGISSRVARLRPVGVIKG